MPREKPLIKLTFLLLKTRTVAVNVLTETIQKRIRDLKNKPSKIKVGGKNENF